MTSLDLNLQPADGKSEDNFSLSPLNYINTVFASWKDISYIFGIEEEWDLIDLDEDPPLDVKNAAFVESIEWANAHTKEVGEAPSCEKLLEVENQILKKMCHHWAAETVVPKNFNFKNLVEDINSYCMKGVTNPDLFPVEPTTGVGIEFFQTAAGISFTLFPPFMIPYSELYYEAYDSLPEWNLEDLNGFDVVETIFFLQEKLNKPMNIDLSNWDELREKTFES